MAKGNFDYIILDMIESASKVALTRPVNLGGIAGSGGGVGGPPGGFIGTLNQTRVSYDIEEIASSGIPASGMSLLDNLNHLRYRIGVVESGSVPGTITVVDNNTNSTYTDIDTIAFSGGIIVTDLGSGDVNVTVSGVSGSNYDGWTAYSAVTPTLTASDDPTYTIQFAGVDLTTFLEVGAPVKWTQNSIVRNGFISSSTFSTNTTVTILTRLDSASTDYDVLDTSSYAISAFSYGLRKQPGRGFVILEDAWTSILSDTTIRATAGQTQLTWYNTSPMSLAIPIGSWDVDWFAYAQAVYSSVTAVSVYGTLSTGASTESDKKWTAAHLSVVNPAPATSFQVYASLSRRNTLELTSKATYYLNLMCRQLSATELYYRNDLATGVIRARCTYL